MTVKVNKGQIWSGTISKIGHLGFSGIKWNGRIEWNGNKLGFHLLIMTTSTQTPPVNKDHPNLMTQKIPLLY